MRLKLCFVWILVLIGCVLASAQQRVEVFREGFGKGGSYVDVSEYTGWDNPDCTFEGTGRIGSTKSHICTLAESSKQGYLYFSSDNIKDMKIRQLDIAGYKDLELSYNLKKSKASSGELLVEIYVDGKKVASYHPNLKSVTGWFAVPVRSIPAGNVMDLYLCNDNTSVTLYLDDLVITGVADAPSRPEKPLISPEPGLYTQPVSLTIDVPTGTSVYYTLDGTEPTENSEQYLAPVILEETATVSAVAVSEGGQSDVVTAHYEIIQVPVAADLQAFREAEGEVRLNMDQADVVDTDENGIYVQMSDGGLLLPAGALAVSKGDRLSGFLIGKPQMLYGMTGVADGVFRALSVTPGATPPVPFTASLSEIELRPERYAACFLQLEGVTYQAEDKTIHPADEAPGNSLRVKTGDWELADSWEWPEKMTIQGVLKGDEDGLYLWVASASQVIASGEMLSTEPLGTALVITERDGTYYAAQTRLSKEGLLCTPVAVMNGQAVASEEDASDLLWEIRENKGYLMTPDGDYLQASTSGTGLKWADSPDEYCVWCRHPEEGYWMRPEDDRALFRSSASSIIKNYALYNLNNSIYSLIPAVDMPLYAGYLRTLSPGHWGTVCVPYAVRSSDFAGALFFEIKGRLDDEQGNVTAVVLSAPVDHLEAGMPYVIYSDTSSLVLRYAGEPVAVPLSKNGLQGSFDGINVDKDSENADLEGKYVLSDNVLRRCLAGSSVGKNRAYVDLDRVPVLREMPEGAMRIRVSHQLSGLQTPVCDPAPDADVHTLDGVFLGRWKECKGHLQKGIYIIQGIKVVLK